MKHWFIKYGMIWILLFGIYAGLRSHTFFSELAHDDGLFLYGGQAWAHGELPYRDFWDHKPPGIFFYHSIPFRLFPFSVAAAKWHEILWLSLSATLLFAFCKRRFLLPTSLFCVAAYVFYTSAYYTIRTGGLTEESALFFVVLCFWLILRRKGNLLKNAFFSGLALGIAFQFRQTYVFELPFLIGALLHNAHYRGEKFTDVLTPFLAIFLGLAIPELIISFYFFLHGAWFTYFDSSYLCNFYYIGPTVRPDHTWLEILQEKHGRFLMATGPYLLAPILALTTWKWVRKDTRWIYLPLLLAFIGEMVAVSLSGEYYEHYYVQASVSTCLLLAFFAEGLLQFWKQRARAGLFTPGSAIAALASLTVLTATFWPWVTGTQQYISDYKRVLDQRQIDEGLYAYQRSVAQAIATLTDPQDRILLIGRDPNSVYMLSKRYAGARYYHVSPLWKPKFVDYTKDYHKQAYFDDVKRHQPAILIVDFYSRTRDERGLLRVEKFFPPFMTYIEENYTLLEDITDTHPEDLWFWYGIRTQLLIRNDKKKQIQNKYNIPSL
jgi:hypothetical protein